MLQQGCVLPTGLQGCLFKPWICSKTVEQQELCGEVPWLRDGPGYEVLCPATSKGTFVHR